MKAPDKICIKKDDTAPLGFTPHWIYTIKVQEQDIVYIRKDALLEWAKEQKQAICINGNKETAYDRGQYSVIQALIDKLK